VRKLCGIFLFALLPLCVFATAPKLASITPAGGQRGMEVQISFNGERLQDAEEIISYEPGLEVRRLNLVTNKLVTALVKIAPDCRLGEHHLRLRTASGISELRTFFVGPFPVISEIEPNNLPAQAQKIALNTTVAGVITSEDVDCFAVQLKKGERLSAEVEGMRLGRGVFDPQLAVLETNGTVLADVDDTWLAIFARRLMAAAATVIICCMLAIFRARLRFIRWAEKPATPSRCTFSAKPPASLIKQ
jgi:hypothetical protein